MDMTESEWSMPLLLYSLWTGMLTYNLWYPYMGPLSRLKGKVKIASLLAILWTTELAVWRVPFGIAWISIHWKGPFHSTIGEYNTNRT
jgi:hypothetical protein